VIWRAFVALWETGWGAVETVVCSYDRARRFGRRLLPRRRRDTRRVSSKPD